MDDDLTTDPAEQSEEEALPWVRDYVTVGVSIGGFREETALAVVERTCHPNGETAKDTPCYVVRHAEQLDADVAIGNIAHYLTAVIERMEARRVMVDANDAGMSVRRGIRSHIENTTTGTRHVRMINIIGREPSELVNNNGKGLPRVDLLSAIRMALDEDSLVFTAQAQDAQAALNEYRAHPPRMGDMSWKPPATWRLVLAFGLAVWQLDEQPAGDVDNGMARKLAVAHRDSYLDLAWSRGEDAELDQMRADVRSWIARH